MIVAKHRQARNDKNRPTQKSIRRRLFLENCLPAGVPPTPENMLLYYGISS